MKTLQPYLFFEGQCEEAIHFYADCLQGSFHGLQRYGDTPGADSMQPDKILYSMFKADHIEFMASDSDRSVTNTGSVALALNLSADEPGEVIFEKLSAGGQVTQPLVEMYWGARFGMLIDKFGVHWMMNFEKAPTQS